MVIIIMCFRKDIERIVFEYIHPIHTEYMILRCKAVINLIADASFVKQKGIIQYPRTYTASTTKRNTLSITIHFLINYLALLLIYCVSN